MGDWIITTLGKAPLQIVDGDRGSNYPGQEEFFPSGHCLFLNAGNVTPGGFNFSNCAFITREKDQALRKGRLCRNDVVLTTRGTVGNAAYFDTDVPFDHIRINSGMVIFRAQPPMLQPLYLYHFVRSTLFHAQVEALRTGSAQPQLPIRDINRIRIPLPPAAEQLAIASVLGALDDKIDLNRRINKTLEAMARAIFNDWVVDFGPARAKVEGREPYLSPQIWALFPDRLDDEGKPEGWHVRSIYEIANVIYGAPFASAQFNAEGRGEPLIRIRDLVNENPGVWTPEVHPKGYKVRPGDIVVGMDGEFRAYLWGGAEAWLNQRVCVFVPKQGFSAAFVRNSIIELLAHVEATETATTVIHLGKSDIDRFSVVVPTAPLLAAFNDLCQPLYDRIVTGKREVVSLASTRDLLVPKLMSGQIRLREAEKAVEVAL